MKKLNPVIGIFIACAIAGVLAAILHYQNGKNKSDSEIVAMRGVVERVVPQYSWFETEKLETPSEMPKVSEKVRLNARVPDRFFLNYCTFGYTMHQTLVS